MKSLQELFADIAASPRSSAVRTVLPTDKVVQQGDVYFHAVPADHPHGDPLGTNQVAVGSTVGARHTVEGPDVTVYAGTTFPPGCSYTNPALLGPLVVGRQPFDGPHPEHATNRFPAGVWQVTYQLDEATQSAVRD